MVDWLVKSKTHNRASGNGESGGPGSICLRSSVATDVIAGNIGDRTVVVGVLANVLVLGGFGAVGNQVREAVMSQSSVGACQQTGRGRERKLHVGDEC